MKSSSGRFLCQIFDRFFGQCDYLPLINALFSEVNPIPVKKAMELLGWKVGGLRLPLVEPSEEHIAYIKRELENAGCKI